ncbi:MAG: GAF domain-containing protein [Bacillati bacterium ANGP1]|uniref:GAF domain-containing protein n=1 Tax=Candidatus Segetimicrobium genomatis TaxID=2569760 RepID=A0A537LTD6_9BACT|nr:MAG: GAF domain-containing protein [Terrabacteria group bacterium ANGP1]
MAQRSRRSRSQPERAPAYAPDSGSAGGESAPRNGQGLATEAEEMALRLECVKLADEQLPLRLAYTRYLDLVHRTLSFEHGTLYVTEWTSGRLLPVAVRGNRVELADRIRFARGSGLSAWVAQEGRPVVIPDPGSNGHRSPFGDAALRAFLAFPLVQQGIVAGVLALARTDRTFTEGEFERLGRLAESLAQTLSKLRREERLRELVYQDGETGLSNSHHFTARLEEELQRTRQHTTEFAVALLEVDIAAGPERAAVVGALTHHVAAAMRTCDLAANLGGRRFGLLFAGLDREKASIIVDRVVRVAQRELRQTTVSPLPMRLSVVGSAEQDESPDALLQRAASALADIS